MLNISKKSLFIVATTISIVAMLLLVWMSLGVGLIGADGDPANLMYFAVIAVGLFGSFFVRFQSIGMAITLTVMALIQIVITIIVLFYGLGLPWSGPLEILLLNGFFIAVFAGAAWLYLQSQS